MIDITQSQVNSGDVKRGNVSLLTYRQDSIEYLQRVVLSADNALSGRVPRGPSRKTNAHRRCFDLAQWLFGNFVPQHSSPIHKRAVCFPTRREVPKGSHRFRERDLQSPSTLKQCRTVQFR